MTACRVEDSRAARCEDRNIARRTFAPHELERVAAGSRAQASGSQRSSCFLELGQWTIVQYVGHAEGSPLA